MLGHERINCIAHCLHLLLTVDSLFKVPQLCVLLRKCKDVISCLHFKGHLVAQEIEHEKDADLFERVTSPMEQLAADEDNMVEDDSTDNQSLNEESITVGMTMVSELSTAQMTDSGCDDNLNSGHTHLHASLKGNVPTLWNSMLEMV